MVVGYHVGRKYDLGLPRWLDVFMEHAHFTVSFFFMLSGFILAYNYAPAMAAGKFSLRLFVRSRFARIYPMYLVGLAAALPFFLHQHYVHIDTPTIRDALELVAQGALVLAMMQAWHPETATLWNGQSWSLSAELFFYTLFPFITLALYKMERRRAWALGLGLWALSMIVPLYNASNGVDEATFAWKVEYFTPILRLPDFVLGVLVGGQFLRWREARRAAGKEEEEPRGIVVAGLVSLLAMIVIMSMADRAPKSLMVTTIVAPFAAMFLFMVAAGAGPVTRLLDQNWMVKLGDISYGIYILHVAWWWMFQVAVRQYGYSPVGSNWFYLLYCLTLLPIAWLATYLVEVPARRFLLDLESKKRMTKAFNERAYAAKD